MGLSDPRIFFITLTYFSMFLSLSADMSQRAQLSARKNVGWVRKAILHVRRKIPPQCKYSFARTSVLQENRTISAFGEYWRAQSCQLKRLFTTHNPDLPKEGFFIS